MLVNQQHNSNLTIKPAGLCLALSKAYTLLCCLTPTQQMSLPLAAIFSSCCPRVVTNLTRYLQPTTAAEADAEPAVGSTAPPAAAAAVVLLITANLP